MSAPPKQDQDRYAIIGEIASGGTATVYLAQDKVLRRKVALKRLHPHLINHPETLQRFEKEAVAIASLAHENVIRVYDFGLQSSGHFLAMEYIDGTSLQAALTSRPGDGAGRRLPNLAALSVFRQLLLGLAAAHEKGIVHRDIKPSNILIDRKGCVRIADFGIAFLNEEKSITKTGAYLGTPHFSSPEQAEGRPGTDRTDVFASGIVMYRCLTGALPFDGATPHGVLAAIATKKPPRAAMGCPRLLPGFSELIEAMLAKRPEDRPSAAECARRVEAIGREWDFPISESRMRRFLEAPEACEEEERREISQKFQAAAMRAGNNRQALKLASVSEIFGEPGRSTAGDAMGPSEGRPRSARRVFWLAAVALALAAGVWLYLRMGPAAEPPRSPPPPIPKTAEIPVQPALPAPPPPGAAAPAAPAMERREKRLEAPPTPPRVFPGQDEPSFRNCHHRWHPARQDALPDAPGAGFGTA